MPARIIHLGIVVGVCLWGGISAAAQAARPAGKKIWTNEDLEELRKRVPLSEFFPRMAPSAGGVRSAAAPDVAYGYEREKDAEWYREQAQTLRAELARVEEGDRSLRGILSDPLVPRSGFGLGPGNARLTPEYQLQLNAEHRARVRQQLDELETRARRNGIRPGAVR